MREYYKRIYWEDYRYTESQEQIWMPFKYITERPHLGNYQPFHCRYHVQYENLKRCLREMTKDKGYDLFEEYKELERELLFFVRKEEKRISLFEVIHIKKYTEKEREYLNNRFVDFWKKYIGEIGKEISVNFMFLLCVDEETKTLKKEFLDVCCVYHKKGRHRLPAVWVCSENNTLDIVANNTERKCFSEYRNMRRELMEMLQISLNDEDNDVYVDEEGKRVDNI